MATNNPDIQKYRDRNAFMLKGPLARKGYDWWWHTFTAMNKDRRAQAILHRIFHY